MTTTAALFCLVLWINIIYLYIRIIKLEKKIDLKSERKTVHLMEARNKQE